MPIPISLTSDASIFIVIPRNFSYDTILCCFNGIRMCGTKAVINHSLCYTSLIPKLTLAITILNRWSKYHTNSFRYCFISCNSVIYSDSNFVFLNSLISLFLIYTRVFWGFPIGTCTNFMYQSNARHQNFVASCPFLISFSCTCFTVHIAWHRKQYCSGSLLPLPWNKNSLRHHLPS